MDDRERTKTEFVLEAELRRLTRALTASIRDKKQKSEVAREYEDHIRDAMQNYMLGGMSEEAAFHAAREDLGDIEEIAATLGDVHNQDKIPADVRREIMIKRTVLGVVFGALYLFLLIVWDIFVVQMTVLIGGLVLGINLCILLSAWKKRRRAMKSIRKYAKAHGYRMQSNRTVYTSIWRAADEPSVILENDTQYIKVRFLATLHKNRALKFLGRNIYMVTRTYGNMMLARTLFAPGWVLFRPRNLEHLPRAGAFLMAADYNENVYALPTLECRHDPRGKEVHEVLILNPVPMRAFYREGTIDVELVGGEQMDGVWLHDIVSFGTMLARIC